MKAARIHQFGPPSVIVIEELPRPAPGHGEVLVRVAAAGVGPWDALIREQKSVVKIPLPGACATLLSGNSRFAYQLCGVCADMCDACAAECEKYSDVETMRICAEACRRCGKTCREVAQSGPV